MSINTTNSPFIHSNAPTTPIVSTMNISGGVANLDSSGNVVSYTSVNNVSTYGSYYLKGYSTPSTSVCAYDPLFSCHWGGWDHTKLECSTDWTNWCCCTNTPSVEIYPNLTFALTSVFPLKIIYSKVVTLPTITPLNPIAAFSLYLEQFSSHLTVTGFSSPINVTIHSVAQEILVQYDATTDLFNAYIALQGVSTTNESSGYTYDFSLSCNVVFSLKPGTGYAWITLQFPCNLKVTLTGSTVVNTNFTIVCPLTGISL